MSLPVESASILNEQFNGITGRRKIRITLQQQ